MISFPADIFQKAMVEATSSVPLFYLQKLHLISAVKLANRRKVSFRPTECKLNKAP